MVASVGIVEAVLHSANREATAYNDALNAFGNGLSPDNNAEMQALVARMLQQTQDMQQQNDLLRAQLEQSSGEIEKLRSNLENVENDALTDGLTQVGNRRCFDIRLRDLTARVDAGGDEVCLLLFDVDHFKVFNDSYGHQMGDQVLRLVAQTLQNNVKGRDVVARYGGEEFAVILTGLALSDAVRIGNQIRNIIATQRLVRKCTGEEIAAIADRF